MGALFLRLRRGSTIAQQSCTGPTCTSVASICVRVGARPTSTRPLPPLCLLTITSSSRLDSACATTRLPKRVVRTKGITAFGSVRAVAYSCSSTPPGGQAASVFPLRRFTPRLRIPPSRAKDTYSPLPPASPPPSPLPALSTAPPPLLRPPPPPTRFAHPTPPSLSLLVPSANRSLQESQCREGIRMEQA